MEPRSPSSSCFSVPPISTMHSDSGCAGRACMLSGCKQSCRRQREKKGKEVTTGTGPMDCGKQGVATTLRSVEDEC